MDQHVSFDIPKNTSRRNYIRGLLALRGIRVVDIARHLGVTKATVSFVIAGRTRSHRVQKIIAEMLDMPFETLWGAPE